MEQDEYPPRNPSQPFNEPTAWGQPQPRPTQPIRPSEGMPPGWQSPPQPPRPKRQRLATIGLVVFIAAVLLYALSLSAPAQQLYASVKSSLFPAPTVTPTATYLPAPPTETPTATWTPRPVTPTPTPTFSPWKTILSLHGNGDQNTDTFTVPGHWQILWSCDPSSFGGSTYHVSMFLHKPNGDIVDEAFSSACTSTIISGTAPVYRAGTFYLEVISSADWYMSVQVPQ